MPEYTRHEPEKTLLHQVVREQLEPFLASARHRGAPMARFVERELRAYLDCGVLANGFLRVSCGGCGHDRLVAFSCKGRGLCPSCGGRRMADTAAHLVDHVLPRVPVRQWVLTLPYPLRLPCAWDSKLASSTLRAFLRALFAEQRRRAKQVHGVRNGQSAAVTFIQRFGSALNLTPHFHSLVLDGVYAGPAHAPGPFLPLPPPEIEDVARVMAGTARRLLTMLERRNLDRGGENATEGDRMLATLMAASVGSRIASGDDQGQTWRRLGDRVEPSDGDASERTPPRCVREGGMSLHADVAVPARDRKRLERLCRYVARPAIALDRLEALPDGRLTYRLKTRWRDGTTHVLMKRHELLERLAPLIPPPRSHQVRYHGLLAPCASGRDRIVPQASPSPSPNVADRGSHMPLEAPAPGGAGDPSNPNITMLPSVEATRGWPLAIDRATTQNDAASPPEATHPSSSAAANREAATDHPTTSFTHRLPWAELLQRVFELDALRCPRCGGRMRVLAAITDAETARRILKCLSLPARAPPLRPHRASELALSRSDEGPVLEQGSEIWPDSDFDQSLPSPSDLSA